MKKWMLMLSGLALLISGCSAAPSSSGLPMSDDFSAFGEQLLETLPEDSSKGASQDEVFEAYMDQYVIQLCQNDYTLMHHYFIDPEAYGIDPKKAPVTLGDVLTSEDDKVFDQKVLKGLEAFDADALTATNRQILEQLKWQTQLSVEAADPKYDYIAQIWGENDGVPATLISFFSEYQLYDKADIKPLVELIADTPNYVDKALDYSKKQAEKGMLQLDLDAVIKNCKQILEDKENCAVISELDAEVDTLMLGETDANACKQEIHEALEKSFFPSFQTIIDELSKLEDKIQPYSGMASMEHGADYYTLLLSEASGKHLDVDSAIDELNERLDDLEAKFDELTEDDQEIYDESQRLHTSFGNVEDILPFLAEEYNRDFPVVDEMDYELKPLSKEQSSENIAAYFVVPPIDSKRPYEIRYNKEDYGDEASSFSFYDTLAHEGIPGHMYQQQFCRENFTQTVQYMLDCSAFTEGYATYAAQKAWDWLDLDAKALETYQVSEEYNNLLMLVMDLQINGQGMSLDEFNEEYGGGMEGIYNTLCQMPTVFFSYYYGSLQMNELEAKARKALGDDFSASEFNYALLKGGNLNFDLVEENIDSYIAKTLENAGSEKSDDAKDKDEAANKEAADKEAADKEAADKEAADKEAADKEAAADAGQSESQDKENGQEDESSRPSDSQDAGTPADEGSDPDQK